MADVHSSEVRSYNMSRIRSKDTKPEIILRKSLFAHGFRYRLHDKTLYGKPDIVLKKYNTIIFVHGCFWHGHDQCRYFVVPKTRTDWWLNKIESNRRNDANNIKQLRKDGWNVIVIYECDLRKENLDRTIVFVVKNLRSQLKN
jgi:DNA mismatch endonuclease (patch repair protein)